MTEIIGDVTFRALTQAMNGLALRQRAISDNLANLETPGFLSGKVDFENALKEALGNGENPLLAGVTTARSLEPTRLNGNNVNLDEETMAGLQTVMTTQLASQALTAKFQRLRTAIVGQ